MSSALYGFLVGCGWFFVFLMAHLAVIHLIVGAGPTKTLVRAFIIAVVAAGATVAFTHVGRLDSFLIAEVYAFLTMACLFIVYSPFFYTVFTSLSIESLTVIFKAGGSMPTETLFRRYTSRELFVGRLRTLEVNGYLKCANGCYTLTCKGLGLARGFVVLKSAWRLGAGG